MKRSVRSSFMVLLLSVGVFPLFYLASYVCFRFVRPEFINTNDGPVAAYRLFYYPIRYFDAERPPWYSKSRDGWLEVKVDWINVGNGHRYFLWDGQEARAGCAADLRSFKEGDIVLAHFRYDLATWDDFRSRLVPCIDMVKPTQEHVRR